MKQLITWTALPNGFGTAKDGITPVLKISVRASPRLTPDNGGKAPISSFADFHNWTDKPWRFSVLFGDYPASGPVTPTISGVKPVNELLPDLWIKLFQSEPSVMVHERITGDYSNPVVRSFPARRVHEFIKKQYTAIALEFPTELPSPGSVYNGQRHNIEGTSLSKRGNANFSPLDFNIQTRELLERQLYSIISEGVVPYNYPVDIDENNAVQLDFYQAELFHAFKGGQFDTPPKKPELDFHKILAMLGDYPELLRALGLVFDFELSIPAGIGSVADQIVRIWPENRLSDVGDSKIPLSDERDSKIALATLYDFDGVAKVFSAKAAGSLIKNGHLDMSGKDFAVAQVDIDGSALKAINFTQTLGDLGIHKPRVLGTPKTAALPALRSGGMSVLMNDRASELIKTIHNGTGFEAQLATEAARKEIKFHAEDITRGYCIDIYDEETGKWRSLCQRTGCYSHSSLPKELELEGEGTVTLAPISSSDSSGSKDLYLHEALFHWDGWSLSVNHPGLTIRKPLSFFANMAAFALKMKQPMEDLSSFLKSKLKEKTLFALASYKGDGTDLEAKTVELERYLAKDIVAVIESGSIYTDQLFSGVTMRAVTMQLLTENPQGKNLIRLNRLLLEDAYPSEIVKNDSNNVGNEPTDIENAIGLEIKFKVKSGSLPKLRFGHQYKLRARTVDIAGNSRLFKDDLDATEATSSEPYLRFEPVASPAMMSDPGLRPGESVDRLVIRSWEPQASNPTDETTRRHILAPRTSVQMAEQHGMIDTAAPGGAASWHPELVKRDAAAITEFLSAGDTLDEAPYLPDPIANGATFMGLPGADAPLAFPVSFSKEYVWPHTGTFRIILKEGVAGFEWNEAKRELVVFLPKAERITIRMSSNLSDVATLEKLGIWKWISEATPSSWLDKFRKIAVEGRHWMITPFREITFIHAVQCPHSAPVLQGASALRSAGDTFFTLAGLLHVHGKSTDKVDFRAAWEDILPKPKAGNGFGTASKEADACHFKVSDPELLVARMSERHELGDTRHRRISYWATATSRFREYFEEDTIASPPTNNLVFTTPPSNKRPADFILDVPSSARPLSPKIEYIIPTFGWEEERNSDGAFRRRTGNSLRVYMSGEWFSSGEGELLGVILAHGPLIVTQDGLNEGEINALYRPAAPVPPETLQPFVTRWGIDPIWLSGLVHQTPTLHHFPDATVRATNLLLEENPEIPAGEPKWGVAVAGHAVAYDSERQLWYCDITIDAGPSYYPFVRLALARYQPCSVAKTELSRVFTADCVQTIPERLVWVGPNPKNPFSVRVSLSGVAPRHTKNIVCPNRVIVRAEICMPGTKPPVWAPLGTPWVPLSEMQVSKTVTVWNGEIYLPQVRDAQRYRLVVEEYEFLNADPGRGLDTTAASALRMATHVSKTAVWPRLVYSDTIELNPALMM
jgi:hypothetical protein